MGCCVTGLAVLYARNLNCAARAAGGGIKRGERDGSRRECVLYGLWALELGFRKAAQRGGVGEEPVMGRGDAQLRESVASGWVWLVGLGGAGRGREKDWVAHRRGLR